MTDQHLGKLHTTFNEFFVPKAFYPLLEYNFNEKSPEKIFAKLIECIVQAVKHLEQDPVHKNSLPSVEALTASQIKPPANTNN